MLKMHMHERSKGTSGCKNNVSPLRGFRFLVTLLPHPRSANIAEHQVGLQSFGPSGLDLLRELKPSYILPALRAWACCAGLR
jgi:hypothetical protein